MRRCVTAPEIGTTIPRPIGLRLLELEYQRRPEGHIDPGHSVTGNRRAANLQRAINDAVDAHPVVIREAIS